MMAIRKSRGGAQRSPHSRRPRRNFTWRERAFVLGGLGLAAIATAASLVIGAGAEYIGPLWMAAVAWTAAASLAGALGRGFRHRDWSAFGAYELPDGRGERLDWDTRTGSYAWMEDWEDRRLHDDDRLRDHDHGSLPS